METQSINPPIKALLFDLDGVLTDTAEYHFQAWKRLAEDERIPFTRADNEQLRGVSRRESLNLLLKGRAIDDETAHEWMERKNRYYRELLQELTPDNLLPGVEALLADAQQAGLKLAVVSASRNSPEVLQRLGITELFDAVVTGADVGRPKPAPDLFLLAARRLGVSPPECVVIEDAASGIDAAHAAGMPAVGLGPKERVGQAEVVLPDLANAELADLLRAATWQIRETAFEPAHQHHRETIFTLGNGYLCTRGTLEERFPEDRQATLLHGLWDDAPLVYTELVNGFDWTVFDIWIDDQPFRMDLGTVSDYSRYLDLRTGELHRILRWTPPHGQAIELHFVRFAHLADPHAMAARLTITPLETDARVTVRARIDGHVANEDLLHWRHLSQWFTEDAVFLQAKTRRSDRTLVMGMGVQSSEQEAKISRADCPGSPGFVLDTRLLPAQSWSITKLVSVFTDRDEADPALACANWQQALGPRGFDQLRQENRQAWQAFWDDSDVIIEGDDEAQVALRHALFQLRIAAPEHDERVSIGAKSLSGFGYRGHVFWDTEIFMLPFFTFTQPKLAHNLLMYRWHTLPGARKKAAKNGFAGAQYAWESAESGEEVTPRWVPDPQGEELIRIWCGDIELHITADVAYGIWQYWQATGDDEFMARYGAPIILETARFWESRVEENRPVPGKFAISDVIGPDEYHDHVDNNAYTNRMVIWHLEHALKALDWLRERDPERASALQRGLDLTPERLARWRNIMGNLVFHQDPETGLIEQFDGFFLLPEVDWPAFGDRTTSMQVLLGIDGANAHQVLKQPDVILLLCLLRDAFSQRDLQANWDYYAPRTDHSYGSSLGPAVHAWAACELGQPEIAYEHFMRAAKADLWDVRGNAGDGIHAASAGGLWQAVVFGFAGLRFQDGAPVTRPRLPKHWRRLAFSVIYRGKRYRFDLRHSPDQEASSPR